MSESGGYTPEAYKGQTVVSRKEPPAIPGKVVEGQAALVKHQDQETGQLEDIQDKQTRSFDTTELNPDQQKVMQDRRKFGSKFIHQNTAEKNVSESVDIGVNRVKGEFGGFTQKGMNEIMDYARREDLQRTLDKGDDISPEDQEFIDKFDQVHPPEAEETPEENAEKQTLVTEINQDIADLEKLSDELKTESDLTLDDAAKYLSTEGKTAEAIMDLGKQGSVDQQFYSILTRINKLRDLPTKGQADGIKQGLLTRFSVLKDRIPELMTKTQNIRRAAEAPQQKLDEDKASVTEEITHNHDILFAEEGSIGMIKKAIESDNLGVDALKGIKRVISESLPQQSRRRSQGKVSEIYTQNRLPVLNQVNQMVNHLYQIRQSLSSAQRDLYDLQGMSSFRNLTRGQGGEQEKLLEDIAILNQQLTHKMQFLGEMQQRITKP